MTLRIQVAIPEVVAGVGADQFVNTWHFRVISPTDAATAADAAIGWLRTFYQDIDVNFSSTLAGTPAIVKAYDLTEAEPRSPVVEDTIDLVMTSGEPLPPELAICLSYRAVYTSGVNKARRRGRVYLGPWTISATDTPGRPLDALADVLAGAADDLLTSSQASTEAAWVVYSPTAGSDQLVTGGWVDNEWDVQRRRSLLVSRRAEFGSGH